MRSEILYVFVCKVAKSHKSAGPDEINIETIKQLGKH